MKKILSIFLVLFMVAGVSAQHKSKRIDNNAYSKLGPDTFVENKGIQKLSAPFLPGFTNGDYSVGPEIQTSLSGWYDYMTNGDAKHYILMDPANPLLLHAIYTTSDSTDPAGATSRRTKYAVSSDGGLTWAYLANVPDIRSGFGYMDLKSDGSAVITNHNTFSGALNGELYVDAFAQLGSFTQFLTPRTNGSGAWPQCNVMTNGNVFLTSESYNAGAATDTLKIAIFNGTTTTPWNYLNYPGGPTNNMRWCSATGANGNVVVAIAPVSLTNVMGSFEITGFKSTNNGVSFGSPVTLFTPFVSGVDTIAAFFGLDITFKPGTTDYYFSYNTNNGFFKGAALWVSKNGGTASKVADSNNVPNTTTMPSWAGITGIDHPSIGWSADGNVMYCAYSVVTSDTGVRGWNTRDVFLSCSTNDGVTWNAPIRITNTPLIDEGYVSISKVNPGTSPSTYAVHMVYMKDPGDGPTSFNGTGTVMPASLNWLIYRKISQPTVSVNQISTEVPSKYSLSQNYPNPFNPTTNIKFAISKTGFVSLKIYDISGREVSSLVNENLTVGTYSYSFDASKLSSGIYFYTMRSNDFQETKKMMLIK